MGLTLREALRQLCLEFGWSYAVFWSATGFGSGMHLTWEDGYCDRKLGVSKLQVSDLLLKEHAVVESAEDNCFSERGCQADDRIVDLVDKIMASQVHIVGDGLTGQAASVGKHLWIHKDTLDGFGSTSKGFADINYQIVAGIQTIVVVPVLPVGVIQLGSTQMVLENIDFINHVKNLVLKLNCGLGAHPSDNTQKTLRQKSQIYSSLGPLFDCRSTTSCTTVDNILPITANGFSHELIRFLPPESFAASFSALPSQMNKKMQPSASEIMSGKQNVNTTTHTIGELFMHGTQDISPKPDIECTQQVMPVKTGSKCQNEPSVSNLFLLSNSLKVLEEELMFTSAIGTLESANNLSTSLQDTKGFPLSVKSESSNNADKLGNSSSIQHGVTEHSNLCAKFSVSGAPQILDQRSCSLGKPGISEVSNKDQPFCINEVSNPVSDAGALKENSDLVQASCIFSSEPDVRVSCPEMPADIFEYEFCYSNAVQRDQRCKRVNYKVNGICPGETRQCVQDLDECKLLYTSKDASPFPVDFTSSSDLFGLFDIDNKTNCSNGSLDDVLVHENSASACNVGTEIPVLDSSSNQISYSELFSIDDSDQLLDAVISKINSGAKHSSEDSTSCKTSLSNVHSSHYAGNPSHGEVLLSKHRKDDFIGFSPVLAKKEPSYSGYGKSSCNLEKDGDYSQKIGLHKSLISSWVENCQNVKYDCVSDSNSKKVAEVGKLNRKRPRPDESPRPRPKDRQMIQDRIKELREIVPNGAKCSIDALLEKTIKHMLFLQSVTKHADKLKVAGEPKISGEEGGLLLKDNFDGGATWAFEVGTQPMICPIIVEDLNPPRQLLVEMLCEERGFFLEIADFIRGLGLTILKGVMEARKSRVWARFAVEDHQVWATSTCRMPYSTKLLFLHRFSDHLLASNWHGAGVGPGKAKSRIYTRYY
ncbi:unnamed protein product [Musa acuminata subsp. burmannicoides]